MTPAKQTPAKAPPVVKSSPAPVRRDSTIQQTSNEASAESPVKPDIQQTGSSMNADAGNEVTANTEEQPAASNAASPEDGSGRESNDNAQNEGPLET